METMYNKQMKIKRLNFPTQDEIGGVVQTLSGETFAKCRIRQLAAVEMIISGRSGVVSTHRIYCSPRTKIAAKDVVVIGDNEYDVNVVQDIHELGKVYQVDCTLRD